MSQEPILDFSKLFCNLHPYELITNFCNDEKCLIGLCATCICTHTQMHAQIGTVPHYQNIRDTFASLHNEARNQVNLIEEDKCKLGTLRQTIEIKKITIRKTIKQLKEDAIQKIKEEFDSLQKKIMADINAQEKKQGYHSNLRLQTLNNNLSKQTDILLSYIEGLNSPHFLAWAKKLKKQSLMETNLTRQKIERQLQENEIYTANLKYNQNFISDLENLIKKVFTLEFVIPKQNQQIKMFSVPFKQSNLNTSSFTRSSSQPKLSNCLTRTNSLSGLSKFAQSTSHSTFFNDAQKNNGTLLHKQTLLKKRSLNVSEIFNNDLSYSKENFMTQSSYVPQSQTNKKSIVLNKFQSLEKPSFESEKLSYLIEAKRNNNFDNPTEILVDEENSKIQNSRIRLY